MRRLRILLELFRMAHESLLSHKLRSGLTMVGIAIGIFLISSIFSAVDSMVYKIEGSLARLGDRVMYADKWTWSMSTELDWFKMQQRPIISYEDYLKVKLGAAHASSVSMAGVIEGKTVKRGTKNLTGVQLSGITMDYDMVQDLQFAEGRSLTDQEVNAARPVCIIGSAIAEELFEEGETVLGKTLRVDGKNVRVIGILKKTGGGMFGETTDDDVYLPFTWFRKYYMEGEGVGTVLAVKAITREDVGQLESELIGLLRASRGLRPLQENNFSINKPDQLMAEISGLAWVFRFGGGIISLFSILVAGFGIGNIMIAAVKERTFEIGLRKSLGATKSSIRTQFLVEALMLCMTGGIAGLLLTTLGVWGLQAWLDSEEIDFEFIVSKGSILSGLIVSALIGLLAGVVPSIKASRLDPVESMRAK